MQRVLLGLGMAAFALPVWAEVCPPAPERPECLPEEGRTFAGSREAGRCAAEMKVFADGIQARRGCSDKGERKRLMKMWQEAVQAYSLASEGVVVGAPEPVEEVPSPTIFVPGEVLPGVVSGSEVEVSASVVDGEPAPVSDSTIETMDEESK